MKKLRNFFNKIKKLSLQRKILIIVFVLLVINIIINAWLCDDAYISFRVVKNFVEGNGLRWNINERVWTYTNPLMVLIMSILYKVTNEVYFTSIFLNIICTTVAVYILIFKISKNDYISFLLLLFLMLSKSFIAYSTSGLENSLTFLLLSIFFYQVFDKNELTIKKMTILFLTVGFVLLNRLDSILIVIPSLIYVLMEKRKNIKISKLIFPFILGLSPFIIWECFSLLYYGFLFPNTAYAKIGTGIATLKYIINGLNYLRGVFILDKFTIIFIILMITTILVQKNKTIKLLLIGPLLSLLYIIYVGGDFMLGRFLTPLYFALCILCSQIKIIKFKMDILAYTGIFIICMISCIYMFYYNYNYDKVVNKMVFGVEDEQGGYFKKTSLIAVGSDKVIKNTKCLSQVYGKNVYYYGWIGFAGYYCEDCIIVDILALSDAFLSRMPSTSKEITRIGHINRVLPEGYLETVSTGINNIEDESLQEYYEKIKLITQGTLFSKERIRAIININLGKYNYLIKEFTERHEKSL